MRPIVAAILVLISTPLCAVTLADDAYVCKVRAIALQIAVDPDLSGLNAEQLAQRTDGAETRLSAQMAKLDADFAHTQRNLDADRAALKSAQALEFQAGVRQNWRPTEQAVHDGEARLEKLNADRDKLQSERKHWQAIADACAAPRVVSEVAVLSRSGTEKLAYVRIGTGASTERVWLPLRFVTAAKRHK